LAEYDLTVASLQALENQEAFLLTLAIGFIDWTLLEEKRRIADERLLLAQEERQLTDEKRRANLVDQVDVLRAEDAVRLASQNLVLVRSQARAKQAELAVLANMPQLSQLLPEHNLYELRDLPSLEQAGRILAEKSRVLQLLETRARRLEQRQAGFREREKPDLNAEFGLALRGGDDELFSSLEVTKPDLSVGISVSQPLGARAARSDVQQAELELQQVQARTERVGLELKSRLHALLIQLADLEEILELNREQIESAREKSAEERRLYNQGRSDLTFVIQAEDNERNARLTHAENAAGYHRLYQQYLALSDLLLLVE
jgi:outer membrane protein TolC